MANKREHRSPLPEETRRVRPFLKWAGGKTQLLPEILASFPRTFGRYHEPFLGGGAVFFALQPEQAVLSDINDELVETYSALRDYPDAVIQELQQHQADETHFYRVRALDVSVMSPIEAAARTIFLNRTCFNGLYRVNSKGIFNVPYGRYANPTICNVDNLLAASRALRKANVRYDSVFNMGRRVARGDLVYFDPPYDPVSATASFTAYAREGFGRAEQIRLAKLFTRLANRGVNVVLSNSDTPFIRDLYRDFKIKSVTARRAINVRADRRGAVGEVIIVGI